MSEQGSATTLRRGGSPGAMVDWRIDSGAPEAVAEYTRAIELKVEDAHVFLQRGDAYYALKDWGRAVADFSQTLARDASQPYTWSQRAHAQAELAQWDKADADLSKAQELNPMDSSTAYYR